MSVTARSMIIAIALLLIAVVVYRFSSLTGQISSSELSSRYPTFEATNFEGVLYNTQGQITHRLASEYVTYFKPQQKIELQKLKGIYYDQTRPLAKGVESWLLQAEKGLLVFDQYAQLAGDIKLSPNFEHFIKEIKSPFLYLDIPNNIVRSPSSITLLGENFQQTGQNYQIDLKHKTFVIKEHPHAVYYPYTNSSNNRM